MIDEELTRLRERLEDLELRLIPEFENRTQIIYAQVMHMPKESEEREKLEIEYKILSKDLSARCDELINTRHQIENLELEKTFGNR